MRIAIGCDDTGLALKEPLVAALEADGHDVLDLGTFSTDPVDYPDIAGAVARAVARHEADAGIAEVLEEVRSRRVERRVILVPDAEEVP